MAEPPPDPSQARRAADDVVHRGVRWQRSSTGALRWWDADSGTSVRHRRGADAPPRPPGWERGRLLPAATLERPPWRSPYRIVPLVLLVLVIGIGAAQALSGSGGQAGAEARAARALVGRCLTQAGFAAGHPTYSPRGVACSTPGAVVRVTEVLPGTPGAPACPPSTTAVVLAFPGVAHPHQLCTVPNGA